MSTVDEAACRWAALQLYWSRCDSESHKLLVKMAETLATIDAEERDSTFLERIDKARDELIASGVILRASDWLKESD
jgi:hypothetical protein